MNTYVDLTDFSFILIMVVINHVMWYSNRFQVYICLGISNILSDEFNVRTFSVSTKPTSTALKFPT